MADNKLSNRNYVDISKLNMYIPKNKGEAKNISNMIELYSSLNVYSDTMYSMINEGILKYDDLKSLNDTLVKNKLTKNKILDYADDNLDMIFNDKEKKLYKKLKRELGLEEYEDINLNQEGLFEFINNIEEINDFAQELDINRNKLMKIIKDNSNIITKLGYDGIDFRKFQTKDSNKYNTVIYERFIPKTLDVKDIGVIKGSDLQNEINQLKKEQANKQEVIKEIC